MPKDKKKSYLVKPQGATVTAGKQNPKVERAANIAKGIAIAAIPVGRAATTVGKVVSAVTKPKLSSAGKIIKSKTFTQGSKANITAKTKGGGRPVMTKGTKVKVDYETKKLSAKQQKNVVALTASQKARRGLSTAKGVVAGAVGAQPLKSDKKASKKKNK